MSCHLHYPLSKRQNYAYYVCKILTIYSFFNKQLSYVVCSPEIFFISVVLCWLELTNMNHGIIQVGKTHFFCKLYCIFLKFCNVCRFSVSACKPNLALTVWVDVIGRKLPNRIVRNVVSTGAFCKFCGYCVTNEILKNKGFSATGCWACNIKFSWR